MSKETRKASIGAALKAKNVKIVNTPTVKIAHDKFVEKPHNPTLNLTSDDVSDLSKWEVGKEYTLTLKVKQTSMRQGSEWEYDESDNSKKTSASFKVLSVKAS